MFNQEKLNNSITPIMRHWRIIFLLWLFIVVISTVFGVNSFVSNPIHPFYLVLITILPSLLFLLITLITSHSFFSQIFLYLISTLFKNNVTHNHHSIPLRYWVQLISNATWLAILTTTIVILIFKFSFQHFDFYLGNTFVSSKEFTNSTISFLNFLPEKLHLINLSTEIINQSYSDTQLTDLERSTWAQWIVVMLLYYGIAPRLAFFLYYLFKTIWFNHKLNKHHAVINTEVTTATDTHETPLITRINKNKIKGSGHYDVALDITDQIRLSTNVIKLNTLEEFQNLLSQLSSNPAHSLTIFIDGNLVPDRGILRRIIRLLDLTETANIEVSTQNHEQIELWKKHLSHILVEGEKDHYEA